MEPSILREVRRDDQVGAGGDRVTAVADRFAFLELDQDRGDRLSTVEPATDVEDAAPGNALAGRADDDDLVRTELCDRRLEHRTARRRGGRQHPKQEAGGQYRGEESAPTRSSGWLGRRRPRTSRLPTAKPATASSAKTMASQFAEEANTSRTGRRPQGRGRPTVPAMKPVRTE